MCGSYKYVTFAEIYEGHPRFVQWARRQRQNSSFSSVVPQCRCTDLSAAIPQERIT